MVINPNILKKIRQIAFTAQEPPNTNILWAKPTDGLFAFYIFYNNKWEPISSSDAVGLPTVSVYLSAFINDVGYLTEDSIKDCKNIIGLDQITDDSVANDSDIENLFK